MPANHPARAWVSTDWFPAASTPLNTVSVELTDAATSAERTWTGATTTKTIRASVGRCRRQILMATSMISPTERGRRAGTSTGAPLSPPSAGPSGASSARRGSGGPGLPFRWSRPPGTRVGRLQRLDQGGVALAATAAEGGGAEPAAPAAQLVDQGHH